MHAYPDAQTVRFKFVEAAECLKKKFPAKDCAANCEPPTKKTVMVAYETWGNSSRPYTATFPKYQHINAQIPM